MEDLLYEFAKENGISKAKVTNFLKRKKSITTLEDLEYAPYDFLNHYRDFSECPKTIKDFIRDNLDWDRYETVTLDDVLSHIRGDFDYDSTYENLIDTDNNTELNSIIEELISNKFGSLICDW